MSEKSNRLKDAETTAWFFEKEARGLKTALARATDGLLAYKNYYGTSVAQVKHLSECEKCWHFATMGPKHCLDYPSE